MFIEVCVSKTSGVGLALSLPSANYELEVEATVWGKIFRSKGENKCINKSQIANHSD